MCTTGKNGLTQKWSEVITAVDELAPLGYSLNANYFDSFSTAKNITEVIFSYNHQSETNQEWKWYMCTIRLGLCSQHDF
jgi:hypothetical protein